MFLASVAVLLSFINVHSTSVGHPFLKWFNKPTRKEEELIENRNQLIAHQNRLSIMDDFAKHSKIQRKINAINQELNEIKTSKAEYSLYMQLFFTYGIKVISFIALAFLSIYFRYTPVFYLESNVNLFPLSGLIAYPNGVNEVKKNWNGLRDVFRREYKKSINQEMIHRRTVPLHRHSLTK